jgi:hypothetical protein
LNALGIDPRKDVTMYRSESGISADKRKMIFTNEDCWNAAGLFASDNESGYSPVGGTRNVNVNNTDFVGVRNDGRNSLRIQLTGTAQPLLFEADCTQLYHTGPNAQPYADVASRFRRDIENADGSFGPNPDWVNRQNGTAETDEITVNMLSRRASFEIKSITIDSTGNKVQDVQQITLDPSRDAFITVGEEIDSEKQNGGGEVWAHQLNPKTNKYQVERFDVDATGSRRSLGITRQSNVAALEAQQETEFDSVAAIHKFVSTNIGLPFVFDTSSGKAVWNYPVNEVKLTKLNEVKKTESNKEFTYTTYRLDFETIGGPSGTPEYILKRDSGGNIVDACAKSPMPDFAFRNTEWTCAPVTTIGSSVMANVGAYQGGYLTEADNTTVNTSLWRRQAEVLFASLTDKTAAGGALVYVNAKNELLSFDTPADFNAAVKADQDWRAAAAAAGVTV